MGKPNAGIPTGEIVTVTNLRTVFENTRLHYEIINWYSDS